MAKSTAKYNSEFNKAARKAGQLPRPSYYRSEVERIQKQMRSYAKRYGVQGEALTVPKRPTAATVARFEHAYELQKTKHWIEQTKKKKEEKKKPIQLPKPNPSEYYDAIMYVVADISMYWGRDADTNRGAQKMHDRVIRMGQMVTDAYEKDNIEGMIDNYTEIIGIIEGFRYYASDLQVSNAISSLSQLLNEPISESDIELDNFSDEDNEALEYLGFID